MWQDRGHQPKGPGPTSPPVHGEPKPDNIKKAFGLAKTNLRCIPPVAIAQLGAIMAGGSEKYGLFNFSLSGVDASDYYEAALRHLLAWYAGEDVDPRSGYHHAAHVMACMAIVLECEALGNLTDDRPKGIAPFPCSLQIKEEDPQPKKEAT